MKKQHLKHRITDFTVNHPGWSFIVIIFVLTIVSCAVWLLLVHRTFEVSVTGSQGVWDSASQWIQAIIGTALVGASAYVAIMIASSAMQSSDASLEETKKSDPDYMDAKRALHGYQQYAFVLNSVLAAVHVRNHTQASNRYERYAYAKAVSDEPAEETSTNGASDDISGKKYANKGIDLPMWRPMLEGLQKLLANESFTTVADEVARFCDKRYDSDKSGETRSQALRKSVGGLAVAVETALNFKTDRTPQDFEVLLIDLFARYDLLSDQLSQGIDGMKDYEFTDMSVEMQNEFPRVRHLSKWVKQIPTFPSAENSRLKLHKGTFADLEFVIKAPPLKENYVRDFIRSVMGRKVSEDAVIRHGNSDSEEKSYYDDYYGFHEARLIATTAGDQASIMTLRKYVHDAAVECKLESVEVLVHAGTPKGPYPVDGNFFIFICKADTIVKLFQKDLICPGMRGCVIVDGLYSADSARDLEDQLQLHEEGRENPGRPRVVDLVNFCGRRYGEEHTKRGFIVRDGEHSTHPKVETAPHIAWFGIEYRIPGRDAAYREDPADFTYRLASIFSRDGMVAGIDAAKLLGFDWSER